jgi:hypothetical protein
MVKDNLVQSMSGYRQAIFSAGEDISDWVADVKKGLNSLYVYCPLVESRMVGDARVPLLRIVPVEGRDGEMIIRVYFHIDFMINFIETHVEFILEFLHVLFPLDGESFWPMNSTHPVTRPNAL